MTRVLIVPALAASGLLIYMGEFTTLEAWVLGMCTAALVRQLWRKPSADESEHPAG